jgi:hypothetical protein
VKAGCGGGTLTCYVVLPFGVAGVVESALAPMTGGLDGGRLVQQCGKLQRWLPPVWGHSADVGLKRSSFGG